MAETTDINRKLSEILRMIEEIREKIKEKNLKKRKSKEGA